MLRADVTEAGLREEIKQGYKTFCKKTAYMV